MEQHFIRENNHFTRLGYIKPKPKVEKVENLIKLYTSLDVNSLNQITELDLSDCNLTNITCSLKKLPLKKLNLSMNNLSEVPRCFYLGLESLEFLDISSNKLKKFEVEPNCCRTLKVLILCSNDLKDIPDWIMNHRATKLKELYYDFNKITTLRCIFGITLNFSVPKLSLRNCILRDEDCAFLKNCKYLQELDIGNADEDGKHLNLIRTIDKLLYQPNWKNLSILKMNNLSLAVYPDGLNWLEGLTELHLKNNRFTWLPKDGLEYLVNLEFFDLSHNFIVYLPEKLSWLVYLKVLNLSYNRIETSYDFSKMEGLEVLDLYSNRMTSFEQHFVCKNLQYFDVEMNYFDTIELGLSDYNEMKDKLRARIPKEVRTDGLLQLTDMINSEENEESDSEQESYSSEEDEEDWDEELRIRALITPSDDEWDGESTFLPRNKEAPSSAQNSEAACFPHIPMKNHKKLSVYNEYVIFCDAD